MAVGGLGWRKYVETCVIFCVEVTQSCVVKLEHFLTLLSVFVILFLCILNTLNWRKFLFE